MRSVERDVVAAAEQRAAALVRCDAAELRRLLHPDMIWTTHTGAVLDRETYIAGNTDGSLVWHDQRIEQAAVTVVGDAAMLTAMAVDEVERNGRRETFRLRLTQTWVRQDGVWQCVAGHAGPRL
jgi:ketosteroid isomerase-like protein